MKTIPLMILSLTAGLTLPASASAHGWQRNHNARAHINHRIHNQQHRITRAVHAGDMTHQQAHNLRGNLHAIRQQERAYAQANADGGHLKREQIKALNQQLNANSKAIGR